MRRIVFGLIVSLFFSAAAFAVVVPVEDFTEFNDAVLTLNNNDEIALSSNIVADAPVNSLTADGIILFGDNYSFDGDGEYSLFNINPSQNLTISSITLKNFANKAGAGIDVYGGVLVSSGGIINIYNSTITANKSSAAANASAYGGAIYNDSSSELNIVNSIFSSNLAIAEDLTAYGGALFNASSATIADSSFVSNQVISDSEAYGGAVYNAASAEMSVNNTNFTSNKAQGDITAGGALFNASSATITNSFFTSNQVIGASVAYGGAIYNSVSGEMSVYNTSFTANKAQGDFAAGGAIYNDASEITLYNSSFYNNSVVSSTFAAGGAIYNDTGTVNIVSDGKDVVFTGNIANGISNAIYSKDGAILNLNAGITDIIFNDAILSEGDNNIININDDSKGFVNSGRVIINADMSGFGNNSTYTGNNVNISSGILALGQNAVFFNNTEVNFSAGTTFDMKNNKIDNIIASDLNFDGAGKVNMEIDVSLRDAIADNIKGSTINAGADIEITKIKLIQEVAHTYDVVSIVMAEDALLLSALSLSDSIRQVKGDVFIYNVSYSSGILTFGYTHDYNPAIFIAPIGMITGGYLEQLYSYEQAFRTVDDIMNSQQALGLWVRPYAYSETVEVLDGLEIDNAGGGVYVGYNTTTSEFLGGDISFSIYGAFKLSDKKYTDATINQQGGLLGVTATLVKGNFFTSLTGNLGITNEHGEGTLVDVREIFMMYTRGLASKTGYRFYVSDDEKFKLVPAVVFSISDMSMAPFVNSNGVELVSSGFSPFTIEPQIRFVADFEDSWYGYAGASAFFNNGSTSFTANGIRLPDMEVKSYLQYSVGAGKAISESVSLSAELIGRSMGRTGFGGQVNFQYKMGAGEEN